MCSNIIKSLKSQSSSTSGYKDIIIILKLMQSVYFTEIQTAIKICINFQDWVDLKVSQRHTFKNYKVLAFNL